jgi:hypothetical protein
MKKDTMGAHAAMGIRTANIKRVFSWLGRSLLEAQSEVPLLRWLIVAAMVIAGVVMAVAYAEGRTAVEISAYTATALLFGMLVAVIFYLLFEMYRKHRSDAIFDSRRLTDLIRKISKEEIEGHRLAEMSLENKMVMEKLNKVF